SDSTSTGLAALMKGAGDGEAQAIIAFQVAMRADPVVSGRAFAAIEAGDTAEQGWRAAMDLQIRGYHEADDLYFRARASDLRDMRDRVLRELGGATVTPVAPGSIVVA